jgi:hypothetical protein
MRIRQISIIAVVICTILASGQTFGSGDPREASLEEVQQCIEASGYSWTAAHTPISDLAPGEFERLLGLRIPDNYYDKLEEIKSKPPAYAPLDLPSQFDWTDSSGVSPVNRQWCGDCWAQCSVAAIESKMRIFDGDYSTRLSVQQAIDCNYGGSSCNGGWWEDVYNMYMVVGGVRRGCYRYVGSDQNCGADTCDIITTIDGWEYIDETVTSIKTHLMTNGPIAVGFTVYNDFSYYSGGCYEHSGTDPVNHGVLIAGWDDSMCGGYGAWHIKNSWGTGWGESGYAWIKYGTCRIGEGAAIVHYTPREAAKLVFESCVIDDSAGDGDGKADPGETVTLPVSLTNKRWETATNVSATVMTTTPGIQVITGSATFPDIVSDGTQQSDSPHFTFSVDNAVLCGERIHFVISMTCDQGIFTDTFDTLVGDAETVFSDDVEGDLGWTRGAPDDDATKGIWKQVNPRGSFLDSMLVQAERDHTPGSGVTAFTTANTGRNLHPDVSDVDGGKTTLLSPVFDLNDYASARVRYLRWYTNDTGEFVDDVWTVDASSDSGTAWVNLETKTDSERDWVPMEFDLGQYIQLTDKVILRFIASDYYDDSTVEAAVDDIEITGCPYWVDAVPATVEVVWPNGGEVILEESEVDVYWTGEDDYGIREFTVLASYDGGATYDDTLGIVDGLDTTLTWAVPWGEYPNCKIGVVATDRGYNTSFDESDSTFTVTYLNGIEDNSIEDEWTEIPDAVELLGSKENPFAGSTHIFFAVPRVSGVSVKIYDARGRMVRQLFRATVGPGYHSTLWDSRTAAGELASSGVYFIMLETQGITKTSKLILAR